MSTNTIGEWQSSVLVAWLSDPKTSALPIIETQRSRSVGLFMSQWERKLGLDRRETGMFHPTVERDTEKVIDVSTRGTRRSDSW